tara:strand:- start:22760 stop:24112 length:1353 start_codon:yes stop_codon:yes gene_type:complete
MSTKRLRAARNGTLNNNVGKKSGLVSRIGRSGTFRWFKVNRACCNPIIVNIDSVVAISAREIRIYFNNPHGLTSANDFALKREGVHNLNIGSDGDFANEYYILLNITPQQNGSGVLDETSTYNLSYNGDKIATSTNNNVEDIKNLDISSVFIDTTDKNKLYVNFKTDLSKTSVLDISQTDLFNVLDLDLSKKITDISNNLGTATANYAAVSGSIILHRTSAATATSEIDISFGTYTPDTQDYPQFSDSSGSIFADSNGKYWIVGKGVDNTNVHVYNHIRGTTGTLGSHFVDLSLNAATSKKIDLSLNFDSDISFNATNFSLDISFNFRDISNSFKSYSYNDLVPQLSNNSKTIVIDISGISGNSISTNTIAKDIEISWNDISGSTFNIDISGIENVVYTKIDSKYLLPINNDYIKTSGGNTVKHVNGNTLIGTFTSETFLASQSSGGAGE